jgi:M6 family metalloprotease-like protein
MRDYFTEVSYGQLTMTGAVTVWLRMPQTYAYYVHGEYGFGAYPKNAQKLTEDAVLAADSLVDFSQYDNNGDGYVDALFIVHAGPGAEATGDTNDIWSHQWETSSPVNVDGVKAYVYAMMPENGTIGVFCHEAGHAVFGLPDLYDTDYTSRGIGYWSLMAYGSWGNGGVTPVHMDAFCKLKVGFLTAQVPVCPLVSAKLPRVEDNKVIYKLQKNGVPGREYFLIENRRKALFDSYLPASGLVIYHVDETVRTGNMNEWYPGHTGSGHYLVAVEQADGKWDMEKMVNVGDAGDPYPGSTTNRTYDSGSTPNSNDYNGNNTGAAVTNISNSGDTMTTDIMVKDIVSPIISCPRDTILGAGINCNATYAGPSAKATDNCDANPTITSSPPLPATFPGVGTYTITWTATDASGNKSTCNQKIAVIDATPPAITCPKDSTMKANDKCQVTYSGPSATANDNCDANPKVTSVPSLPVTFSGVGTYTITWTATDVSGNKSTCDQKVKVIDVTPPAITCPRDSVMKADGNCQVTNSGPRATAVDNCDASPTVTSVPPLPATFTGVGTYAITWTATDASGNKSACDQKITVIDVTPPTITCPKDVTLEADANCQVTYNGPPAAAIDNCDSRPTITSVPPLPATFKGVGTYTITWTATDASGNKSTCDQKVTVTDVTPPAITCPDNVVLPGDGNCEAVYAGPPARASDNCDSRPAISSVPPLPAAFKGAGDHQIVYTATDASGNSSTCTQTVTIIDVTPPVLICPPDTSITAGGFDCSVTYSGPAAEVFDNCDGNPVVTSNPPLPATFYTIGRHDIVFTAVDFSGNTSVCEMTVTVLMTSYCLKNETIHGLEALVPTGEKKIDEKIDKSIDHIWKSLNVDPKKPGKPWKKDPLWVDPVHLDHKHGHDVFHEETYAVNELMDSMKEKDCPPELLNDLMAAILALVDCDEMLAHVQIEDAKKGPASSKEIEHAEKEMVKAGRERAMGKYDKAIEHYQHAWEHAVKAMGKGSLAGVQSAAQKSSPYAFALSQNNPNPFARETTISFTLPEQAHTRLTIHDITGRVVAVLADREMERGTYSLVWNRECCASGIYFYILQSGDRLLTKKMTAIR